MPTDPSRRQGSGQDQESQRREEAAGGSPELSPQGANRHGTERARSSAAARGVEPGDAKRNQPAADSVPKSIPSAARGEAAVDRIQPRRDDAADGAARAADGDEDRGS